MAEAIVDFKKNNPTLQYIENQSIKLPFEYQHDLFLLTKATKKHYLAKVEMKEFAYIDISKSYSIKATSEYDSFLSQNCMKILADNKKVILTNFKTSDSCFSYIYKENEIFIDDDNMSLFQNLIRIGFNFINEYDIKIYDKELILTQTKNTKVINYLTLIKHIMSSNTDNKINTFIRNGKHILQYPYINNEDNYFLLPVCSHLNNIAQDIESNFDIFFQLSVCTEFMHNTPYYNSPPFFINNDDIKIRIFSLVDNQSTKSNIVTSKTMKYIISSTQKGITAHSSTIQNMYIKSNKCYEHGISIENTSALLLLKINCQFSQNTCLPDYSNILLGEIKGNDEMPTNTIYIGIDVFIGALKFHSIHITDNKYISTPYISIEKRLLMPFYFTDHKSKIPMASPTEHDLEIHGNELFYTEIQVAQDKYRGVIFNSPIPDHPIIADPPMITDQSTFPIMNYDLSPIMIKKRYLDEQGKSPDTQLQQLYEYEHASEHNYDLDNDFESESEDESAEEDITIKSKIDEQGKSLTGQLQKLYDCESESEYESAEEDITINSKTDESTYYKSEYNHDLKSKSKDPPAEEAKEDITMNTEINIDEDAYIANTISSYISKILEENKSNKISFHDII